MQSGIANFDWKKNGKNLFYLLVLVIVFFNSDYYLDMRYGTSDEVFQQALRLDSEGKYTEALEKYEYCVERNSLSARNNIGVLYMSGKLGKVDESKALEWFGQCTDQDLPLCDYNFGRILALGSKPNQDVHRGISFIEKAAKQGQTAAYWDLYQIYTLGIDEVIDIDEDKAMEYLGSAASRQHTDAMAELGNFLMGQEIKEGDQRAIDEYNRGKRMLSDALKRKNNRARFYTALRLMREMKSAEDMGVGLGLLEQAANEGFHPAIDLMKKFGK